MTEQARIVLLFSDTGGGHRSAAEAIAEALAARFPGRYQCDLVDFLKEFAPTPFDRLPAWYPSMVRLPRAWGAGFHLSDGQRRARVLTTALWPYVRPAAHRMVRSLQVDLLVSVHPLANGTVMRAFKDRRPPFLTVVTDLVSTHSLWYEPRVDLCLVPTQEARQRALSFGMRPGQVQVVGLPVAARFCRPAGDISQLRRSLAWPEGQPVVLLVGGGEGMGPLYETARAIAEKAPGAALAVVCGRNARLKQQLEAQCWPSPTFVYGFERRMPEMMQAATLLVTKAGPGTITEAINAHLPMVLYSHLPGQEDGNLAYVRKYGVGSWAPGATRTAQAVSEWLQTPEKLAAARQRCARIAQPHAAQRVAEIIHANLLSRA